MANYVNVNYIQSLPSGPSLYVENADTAWDIHDTRVVVAMIPPAWTPTHYKLWNFDGATTSGEASWKSWATTVTGTIPDSTGEQFVYGHFKDASNLTDVVTSSGIIFSWTAPSKSSSVVWDTVFSDNYYDDVNSAKLSNSNYDIDIEFNKDNINHLAFNETDFSGLSVLSDTISCSSSSEVAQLLDLDDSSYVSITKVFAQDETPMIKVDTGSGFLTLTAYDGTIKTDITGDYTGRVDNINYDSGTKTLTFDIYKFSTYGFTTLDNIVFTNDSQNGGYNGTSINLKVRVTDTNGDGVESAPVTFSGISGDNIGNFTANPVNTDVNGYATAELNLTSVGNATYDAYIAADNFHTSIDQYTYCITYPSDISRSLLRQEEQIRRTGTYDDSIANVNTSAVAEPSTPTTSGGADDVLEHDTNVFRTIIKQLKGTADWYTDLGTYFNPANTTSGGASLETFNLNAIKDNTLDSKTVLIAVDETNSGAGFTVSGTQTGILYTTNLSYADWSDRRGLPIFASTANPTLWSDDGGSDDVCAIDLIDTSTGGEFKDTSDDIIYAKFHDGADFGGTGEGTDVYVRFYSNNVLYTWSGTDPDNITFVFPYRKRMDEIDEHEWVRTDFINSFEGDEALVDDLDNLWSYTGSSNNDTSPEPWTNSTASYALASNSDSLRKAIDTLNTEIGDRLYTSDNYIDDGDTITESLDELDAALKVVDDNVSASLGDKVTEELSGDVNADVTHYLPVGFTYTPYSAVDHQAGKNMEVYVNGQLLSASTGADGINADRDYAEVSTSGIQFHFDVYDETNIIYIIKQ